LVNLQTSKKHYSINNPIIKGKPMYIEKYSFGTGDRFGKEGESQLEAVQEINNLGITVVPVWNKSHREHSIVKTTQSGLAKEAADAVAAKGWKGNYYVDADHIGLSTVDEFMDYSNFFTIDVAHFINRPAAEDIKASFVRRYSHYTGNLAIPGIDEELDVNADFFENFAHKYLLAITEVKKIYDYIEKKKGKNKFIPEVSMDECEIAQTPLELFFILAELKNQGVEVQTIAPKFTGLFAKGIDYIGNIERFAREFEEDIAVVKYAAGKFGLPPNLKLSIHSGSDKFSIYSSIRTAMRKYNAGIHIKTAGTTWLEEIIGLAQAGGEGLEIAKKIYKNSLIRYDELIKPYATVLNIDKSKLPSAEEISTWNSARFSDALTHNQVCSCYNPDFRQLMHVGYKIAAELGNEFSEALVKYRNIISENVKYNILERHLKPLFI
jgi:hypothetical protein